MKFLNFALIITAFTSTLSACAVEKAGSSILTPCVLESTETLKLTGLITPAMQSCALDLLTPDITKVIVNSKGGDVDAGRAIGYQLGENPRTLIVETYCLSSCGNYFIPPARAVQLRSGAVIGLHGSPDPHMLSSQSLEAHLADLEANESVTTTSVKRQLKHKQGQRDRQLAEEEKFAARFNVPKGWRHYREVNDDDKDWRRHFEAGSYQGVTPKDFMIVEKAMMASCLPHITLSSYQAGLEKSVFTNRTWAKLEKDIGAYRSLGLKCRPYSQS